MADRSSQTEQPTQRRLEKARKEGQYPSAKEFVSALQFMVFLTLLGIGGERWLVGLGGTTRSLFVRAFAGSLSSSPAKDERSSIMSISSALRVGM